MGKTMGKTKQVRVDLLPINIFLNLVGMEIILVPPLSFNHKKWS